MERIGVGAALWNQGQRFTPTPTVPILPFGIRDIRAIRGPTHQTVAHESHQSTRMKTGGIDGTNQSGNCALEPRTTVYTNPDANPNRPHPVFRHS